MSNCYSLEFSEQRSQMSNCFDYLNECRIAHTKYERHFLLEAQINKDVEEERSFNFCSHGLLRIFRLSLWTEASDILETFQSRLGHLRHTAL